MRSIVPLFALAFVVSAPALAIENVPVPAFRSVELRGGGEVILRPGPAQRVAIINGSTQFTRIRVRRDGKLQIDACNERCPRHYSLKVEIQAPRAPDLGVMGGGSIRAASGFAPQPQVTVAVSGGGAIDVRAIEATNVTAAVNGGGKVDVRARRALTAAVNGGGEVRYWGNPAVTMAVHGGGIVRPGH